MNAKTDKLAEIVAWKRQEVEALKRAPLPVPVGRIRPPFERALRAKGFAVLAEVKRRSPSAGALNETRDPAEIAALYESNGAAAVSVLTDEKYFGGSFPLLREIASKTALPLLCKDFVIDPVQIDLAKANGASAVLLIAEALDDVELKTLYRYARCAGMETLVEFHDPVNLDRVLKLDPPVIGVNNRDLRTLESSLSHSIGLAGKLPGSAVKLSLSSVETPEDVRCLREAGFDGVLVGSSLMKAADPAAALLSFVHAVK